MAIPQGPRKVSAAGNDVLPRWDLSGLFPSPDSIQLKQSLAHVAAESRKFQAAYSGKVATLNSRSLAQSIEQFAVFEKETAAIRSYAQMTGISVPKQRLWAEEIEESLRTAEAQIVFFKVEVNKIPENRLIELMADGLLSKHAKTLADLRTCRPYLLKDDNDAPDTATEVYAFEKEAAGESAWRGFYDMTLRDTTVRIGKKSYPLSGLEKAAQRTVDAGRRHALWDGLAAAAGGQEKTLSLIFNTLANVTAANDKLRGFAAPEEAALLPHRLTPQTAEALIAAASDYHASLSQRYFAWKAKKLGVVRLHPADCHTPSGGRHGRVTWEEAQKTVIEAFAGFSAEAGDKAARFLASGHVDAGGDGKIYGAGASSVPYAAVDFTGDIRDVLSLGKITAQAVHLMLAAEKGNGAPFLPLLETTATLGGMLVFDALLAGAKTRAAQRDICMVGVEALLESALRPAAEMRFEQKFYEAREKNELSPAEIGALWKKAQAEYCGSSVNLEATGAEKLWAVRRDLVDKPFSAPPRIFGVSFGMEIYESYTAAQDKKAFGEGCIAILSAGGKASLEDVLSSFSIRSEEENDWKRGFRAIRRRLDHLFALEDKVQSAVFAPMAAGPRP